jgi:hypothetical protein
MVEYNYEILRLNIAPHKNGMDNVVVSVNWRYQITENSDYADIYYVTDIPSAVDPDSFIAYDDLTDETIFSWVSKAVNLESLKKELQAELEKVKTPEKVEKLPPWDMSVKYTGKEEYLIVTDVNDPNDPLKTFGPMKWHTGRANDLLEAKTDIEYRFPVDVIMYQKGLLPRGNAPLTVNENLKLYKVKYTDPIDVDGLFQYHEGLKWVLDTGEAVGTYFILDRTVEEVKKILHGQLSQKSFEKQVSGTVLTVKGKSVNANTDMFARNVLYQRWSLMDDAKSEEFKLNDGEWFTLTKTELHELLLGINNHIKSTMAWESNIASQINDSITIEDLKLIDTDELEIIPVEV